MSAEDASVPEWEEVTKAEAYPQASEKQNPTTQGFLKEYIRVLAKHGNLSLDEVNQKLITDISRSTLSAIEVAFHHQFDTLGDSEFRASLKTLMSEGASSYPALSTTGETLGALQRLILGGEFEESLKDLVPFRAFEKAVAAEAKLVQITDQAIAAKEKHGVLGAARIALKYMGNYKKGGARTIDQINGTGNCEAKAKMVALILLGALEEEIAKGEVELLMQKTISARGGTMPHLRTILKVGEEYLVLDGITPYAPSPKDLEIIKQSKAVIPADRYLIQAYLSKQYPETFDFWGVARGDNQAQKMQKSLLRFLDGKGDSNLRIPKALSDPSYDMSPGAETATRLSAILPSRMQTIVPLVGVLLAGAISLLPDISSTEPNDLQLQKPTATQTVRVEIPEPEPLEPLPSVPGTKQVEHKEEDKDKECRFEVSEVLTENLAKQMVERAGEGCTLTVEMDTYSRIETDALNYIRDNFKGKQLVVTRVKRDSTGAVSRPRNDKYIKAAMATMPFPCAYAFIPFRGQNQRVKIISSKGLDVDIVDALSKAGIKDPKKKTYSIFCDVNEMTPEGLYEFTEKFGDGDYENLHTIMHIGAGATNGLDPDAAISIQTETGQIPISNYAGILINNAQGLALDPPANDPGLDKPYLRTDYDIWYALQDELVSKQK